jgi:hypothetical protein
MKDLCTTLSGETLFMFDTTNLMIGRLDQLLNKSVAVSMM